MHARGFRCVTATLVVIVGSSLGCRGSRPFGRVVQVTQESDAGLPPIEPPQQRLATMKPREGSATRAKQQVPGGNGSPHVQPTASTSSAAGSGSNRSHPPKNRQILADRALAGSNHRSTSDAGVTQALAAKSERSQTSNTQLASSRSSARRTKPAANDVAAAPPSELRNVAAKLAADAGMDPDDLVKAFENSSPDQREMYRRLVALASHSADRTSQPNSPIAELAKKASNLPELPDAKNDASDVPPTRIASEQLPPSSAAVEESVSDADQPVHASVTDLTTTELESTVVEHISDIVQDHDGQVQPASASSAAVDESMIAQASVDPHSLSGKPAEAQAEELTDEALFDALLKRFATPVAGESEAERNSRLIRHRHLMVLSGDPDSAVEKMEGMSESEQECLRHQLLGLWTMLDPQGHPVASRRFTSALPQFREAVKFAAAATDSLEVRSLAFCTEIESYGQIKTFPGNRFDAGQQVILYCEIENFTVNRTADGFETHLKGSYDIYDEDNRKAASQVLPADQQVSANYLRDYFIAYQMHLPQQLKPGTYRLQLTMEDVNGKKYGQASIPLEIAK